MPENGISKFTVDIDIDLEDIIPQFMKNRNDDMIKLTDAINQKDFKTLEFIAHKLSGNAGSYGFHKLGEYGRVLEGMAKESNFEQCQENVVNICNYIKAVEINFV